MVDSENTVPYGMLSIPYGILTDHVTISVPYGMLSVPYGILSVPYGTLAGLASAYHKKTFVFCGKSAKLKENKGNLWKKGRVMASNSGQIKKDL